MALQFTYNLKINGEMAWIMAYGNVSTETVDNSVYKGADRRIPLGVEVQWAI